jgi:nanoRNase/pAp phosphatase (c-di-AMP/oligoRNAs hydrolase)
MQERLDVLLAAVAGAEQVLILPHNDPDPDAIAAALALRHLLAELGPIGSRIAYQGIVGRAENKALVRYLGRPLRRLTSGELRQARTVALVDTQPGTGNNPLPVDPAPAEQKTVIVFDHHPRREATAGATFVDLRSDVGATSTILVEYLRAAGLDLPQPLATALFYGIKSDTLGLVRGASPADVEAYFFLQPHIDVEALGQIESAQVAQEYFRRLDAALHAARVYGQVVISYVGPMPRPDLAAEMGDLLLRLKGVQWAICSGAYEDLLILAVRCRSPRGSAGRLVQAIVGEGGTAGGHDVMAGGQIPLGGRAPAAVAREVRRRALAELQEPDTEGRRLLAEW